MPSVLFVCTGNLHRSPMAEILFRKKVAHMGDEWRIESAGTWARDGDHAPPEINHILNERGLDADDHRSQIVSRRLLRGHNLILVMAGNHKEALQAEFPDLADRIYLLSEMVGVVQDVKDPIGGPLDDFRVTADEIDQYLTQGFDKICALAEGEYLLKP
jgi:protein-tyrosine-phosphatase